MNELAPKLAEVMRSRMKNLGDTENLRSISDGWESEVIAFSFGDSDYVVRLYQGESGVDKLDRESQGMQCLHSAGYPVPEIFFIERDGSVLGKPFMVMELIAGSALWPLMSEMSDEEYSKSVSQFAELFVRLHTLPASVLPNEPHDVGIGRANDSILWLAEPDELSAFKPAVDWLLAMDPSTIDPCPIHLDYHPNNVILKPDGEMVVIDWTQVTVGDPRLDLAWTQMLLGTYSTPEKEALFTSEYVRCGGCADDMTYFDGFSCLKRLLAAARVNIFGGESLGMRSDAAEQAAKSKNATLKVVDRLERLCGQKVPDVRSMFE